MNALKKSVADGKSAIAAAITSQGVSTAVDASYATMAGNVKTACTNKYNAGVAVGKSQITIASQTVSGTNYGENGSTVHITLTFGNLSKVSGISTMSLKRNEGNGSTRNVNININGNRVIVGFDCYDGQLNMGATVTAFEITN